MKLTFPCITARISSLAPRGICRSAFFAPSKGGTSGHKLLTVPAFSLPVSVSIMRHETTTPTMKMRMNMAAGFLMLTSKRAVVDLCFSSLTERSEPCEKILQNPTLVLLAEALGGSRLGERGTPDSQVRSCPRIHDSGARHIARHSTPRASCARTGSEQVGRCSRVGLFRRIGGGLRLSWTLARSQ